VNLISGVNKGGNMKRFYFKIKRCDSDFRELFSAVADSAAQALDSVLRQFKAKYHYRPNADKDVEYYGGEEA
jgi:hypothetical protein